MLVPRELNGISIRIRNIPIAEQFGYDPTFMRYPNYMDQLYQNWISGEIYVEEGLEEAMNIDRKSFRVTHPQYLALQNFLHRYLRQTVFKITQNIYESNREEKSEIIATARSQEKKKILKTKKITYSKKAIKKSSPVEIQHSNQSTIIDIDEKFIKQFKKKEWEILENIFLIFEIAFKESKGNSKKLKDIFYKKILEWKNTK